MKTRTFITILVIVSLMTGIASVSASFDDVTEDAKNRGKDSAETFGSSDSGTSFFYILIAVLLITAAAALTYAITKVMALQK